MGLNKSTGNMYEWVTHTWNPIKGKCLHDCAYCYVKSIYKRFNKQQPELFLDEKEFTTNLGAGNTIFIGSSCDMFAENVPLDWIVKVLKYLGKFNNTYLFQTRNTHRIFELENQKLFTKNTILCTTIESNRDYDFNIKNPKIIKRVEGMVLTNLPKYITIEPILDFEIKEFVELLKWINNSGKIKQINIGADSGHNHLPEPPKEKILELISELQKFTVVKQKSNLKRLLK